MSYHMAPWQMCPFTSSLVAALELYLCCPVTVVGLHASSWAPLFVLTSPTPAAREKLQQAVRKGGPRLAYWGAWTSVTNGRVRAYRLILRDEVIPGDRTRTVAQRLAESDPGA